MVPLAQRTGPATSGSGSGSSSVSNAPVVAILTYRDESRVFRGNRDNFLDLLKTAKEEGVTAYIVSQDDLHLAARTIQGFTYSPSKKKWVRGEKPFPQVVYNRIPYRKFEQLPEVQQLIQSCLDHPHIRFFNPSFFSKWSLFEWISGSRATRRHAPETVKLSGLPEFTRMARSHRELYLKPVKGKAGRGIMKAQRLVGKQAQHGAYRLTCQSEGGTATTSHDTIAKLYEAVRRETNGKEYIVQQGISLAKAGGRPFDLRALVQKNSRGEWRVSGIGARVAGKSSITTHVPRGGSIDNPTRLLENVFGASAAKSILREAKETALILAAQIEKGSGHTLGEMSMDLGVDKTGKLWFFEANSKPMKFDEPHIRKMSLRRLVRYWKYLVSPTVSGRFGQRAPARLRAAAKRGRMKRRKR